MVIDETQTIVLDPASEAAILSDHVLIELLDTKKNQIGSDYVDPIHLSVFGHRFMSVAEQVCFLSPRHSDANHHRRWAKQCKKRRYQPTSKNDSTIRAPSSMARAG